MSRLSIYIENMPVPVPDGFSLQLNYENPLFSENKIASSYTYNFNLPRTSVLENLFSHSGRIQNKRVDISLPVKIMYDGLVFIEGNIFLTKSNSNSYSFFIRGKEISFRQDLEKKRLQELQLPNYEVCTSRYAFPDPNDNRAIIKHTYVEDWQNFMMQTLSEPVDSGMFKFPMIRASYESPELQIIPNNSTLTDPEEWLANWPGDRAIILFRSKHSAVNHWNPTEEAYSRNPLYDATDLTDMDSWITTISPCLRIEYLLEELVHNNGMRLDIEELKDISEFKRMVCFSGYTLDERIYIEEAGNTVKIRGNVHGTHCNLNDFIPDTSMWDLIILMQQLFDTITFIEGNRLLLRTSREILDSKSIDMSRYCDANYVKDMQESEKKGVTWSYNFDDEVVNFITKPVDFFEGANEVSSFRYGLSFNHGDKEYEEKTVNYIPIGNAGISNGDPTATTQYYTWQEIQDMMLPNHYPFWEIDIPYFRGFSCYSELPMGWENNLSIYSNAYKSRQSNYPFFAITQYLGPIDMPLRTAGELANDLPPSQTYKVMASSSVDGMNSFNGSAGWPQRTWGEGTLFMGEKVEEALDDLTQISYQDTEEKGLFNRFHKPLQELLNNSIPIDKILYLPPHIIIDMISFRNPRHTIKSPDGNFTGYVQKVSLSLSSDGISATKVTYISKQYD